MFSFGINIKVDEEDRIIIDDPVNSQKLILFFDELYEIGLIFKAVSSSNMKDVTTKLSSSVTVHVSINKSSAVVEIGALQLKLTIGQFKALDYYINRILTLFPIINSEGTISTITESQVQTVPQVQKESKSKEVKTTVKSNPEPTTSTSDTDIIELTSSILMLEKEKLTDDVLNNLKDSINSIIGKQFNITKTALEVIIDGVRKIAKDSEIVPESYVRNEYNSEYLFLNELWKKLKDAKTEQDKRLILAAYYVITNYIEVNEMLEQF